MSIEIKTVESETELQQAFSIRRTVFIHEQKVPEDLEMDEWEQSATHFLALEDGKPIGTCRLRWISSQEAKVERVAVLAHKRNTGAGRKLMLAVEETARLKEARAIRLNAQIQVVPFYEKLGYRTNGAPFFEAGIEHIPMIKELN
ncbi:MULTISPECIES: GNAT family N-acetyltransferase [unclassified Thermoactinomyces]|uniref:GNAT family N-acetyltransferase n=1 Tax=unclassified Thermoactinomyces TaxID=2634588 RepID=UPI0018DEA366|nr:MULTISPECIES: GNAT family N-acetyltransferase [unclassified Thermoactinomyces]MBH8603030.1 GNAT family N-acetyltransferase [Thermoactinomyces sp. CICC 10522]MBH8609214.1 GNAT family N-acetyltransferase [Thermoactinomyces sp. CICC 10521]